MIIGTSKDKDVIDNYYGHWLLIAIIGEGNRSWREGWVFSKFVNKKNFIPNEIRITGLAPEEPGRARMLYGTYMNDNIEIQFSVFPNRLPHQPFWTFVWDIYNINFRYDTVPGSYVWFPETNELKHITYIGFSAESAGVIFTDDFRYILHDFGTMTGIRGLSVWKIECGTLIFSGSYFNEIKLNGHTIEIVYRFSPSFLEGLDSEIITFAENFIKENPKPLEMIQYASEVGLIVELIIFCELNIETGARTIKKGKWIYSN